MLLMLAELNAHPHTAAEVATLLYGLAEAARAEPGCVSYAVYRRQDAPHSFLVNEVYRDRAACDAHLASAPIQQALARFDTLLAGAPTLRVYDPVPAA